MSSFKRRVPSIKSSTSTSQTPSIPSTSEPPSISAPEPASASPHPSSLSSHPSLRPSPTSSSTLLTSTGLPSLDDILGGGLPLSCSFLVLAPDVHSAYGELVCKYAVSMGLAGGMAVWIIGGQGNSEEKDWVEECMWMPGVGGVKAGQGQGQGEDDGEKETDGEEGEGEEGSKIKIAWRYEQMKKFQTTVNASNASNEDFCRAFDLTNRIPPAILSQARKSSLLHTLPVPLPETVSSREAHNSTSTQSILRKLKEMLERSDAQIPVRICVPSLGSPEWGDLTPVDITRFLHTLRHLLRTHPHACATISLSPELSSETWGGQGWTEKLGWLSDGCVRFEAFSADPALTSLLPSHHGLLRILTLPNPHTLLPPSDRFSTLRGLGEAGGGGENNLAFRCLRKRMVVERLSLDVEGGVGERRTKKSGAGGEGTGMGTVEGRHEHGHGHGHGHEHGHGHGHGAKKKAVARVEVRVDEGAGVVVAAKTKTDMDTAEKAKPRKERKKVAFRSDKPDLYDF